ncbi:hypothetical protein A2331_02245 [Candidatus Falkowbacteria bacterium RIFOXYB2_FULL_34_18]|uniref:Rod shape-determining protein MreD n=1 Tax=Candidatus Falkowbacteria bacterium RIFOXYD2_FULL_34_120 TaxID=1798007 RepID=A0A1F5TRQ1_9BACT|nr:MAG: hypothetical protein A2331_02245 [Candidatus Falkowbacteria bacterium RIFOXYB2_FULL_34_18]OGF29513.1 MAG: hypothetical protein A2500_02285 [Candidatus Falkowbacteria bacterium RIFOXYC12_FULL_34_55]OGF36877.1 MAG: hypothetical protein A2466_06685 [Candidatus Falkowbacteria bacterium RIFOXYC2_FULL_34_220]OGF39076.1 MAG: hypothetical protein A2515_04690 [Candidatus Falkowbacteria bacterium RIFOXYD12_FULL_34_57]OGF41271.1 MAG: hypothetical protein A2531_00200 [Candidatus Falkowbacteria bact
MYIKFILNILIIFFLFVIQVGFISGLPEFFKELNLFLVSFIFILGLFGFEKALVLSLGIGIFFDFYSFYPFGVYSIVVFITIVLSNFLLSNFLTNRSLYSFLALTAFAQIIFMILLHLFLFLIYFIKKEDWIIFFDADFWLKQGSGLLVNLLTALCFFYIFNFFSKRFKPVFLSKKLNQ